MKGKNGATSFLPKTKKGGWVRFNDKITYIPDSEKKCLTEDQTRHIYKREEMGKPHNIETMTQEIDDDKMIRNRLKEEEDKNELNPYQMAILNKKSRDDVKIEQMINWSIFSDLIKCVDQSSCSDVTPSLMLKPLDDRKHKRLHKSLEIDENLTADIIFEEDRVYMYILINMMVFMQKYLKQLNLMKVLT